MNGASGVLAQRMEKHVVSKGETKQGSEKSYNFLQQRANYVHTQVKQEHVLYKKRIARKEKKVLKIIIAK